jgi:Rrf2 family protein
MATNTRLASAIHIMSFIAFAGDGGTTSEAVAHSLQTNPVVVRKILKDLAAQGLVTMRLGRSGGVELARPAARITVGDIYQAVENDAGIFSMRGQVNDRCVVAAAMTDKLGPIFEAANAAATRAFRDTRLDQLAPPGN